MLKLIPSVLLFLFVFAVTPAHAQLVSALKIDTEYFPDTSYEVGFDLQEKSHLIERVYFQESNTEPHFFTLNELQQNYIVVFKKFSFNFVKLKVLKMSSPTAGTIEINFLKNAVTGVRSSLYYDVALNPQSGRYEITDQRTHQVVKNLLVTTNFKAGMPVGIRDIEAQ